MSVNVGEKPLFVISVESNETLFPRLIDGGWIYSYIDQFVCQSSLLTIKRRSSVFGYDGRGSMKLLRLYLYNLTLNKVVWSIRARNPFKDIRYFHCFCRLPWDLLFVHCHHKGNLTQATKVLVSIPPFPSVARALRGWFAVHGITFASTTFARFGISDLIETLSFFLSITIYPTLVGVFTIYKRIFSFRIVDAPLLQLSTNGIVRATIFNSQLNHWKLPFLVVGYKRLLSILKGGRDSREWSDIVTVKNSRDDIRRSVVAISDSFKGSHLCIPSAYLSLVKQSFTTHFPFSPFQRLCSALIPLDMIVTSFSSVAEAISRSIASTLADSCKFNLLTVLGNCCTIVYTPNGVAFIR